MAIVFRGTTTVAVLLVCWRQCSKNRPDLMLLAGDLFDSNKATTETITWAMQQLESQPYPVVMIPGNHDCLLPGSIYSRFDFNAISNTLFLGDPQGERHVLRELDVCVWGKGMPDHTPAYKPLAGCPAAPSEVRWYIGLGHGIYVPDNKPTERSSPVYAQEIDQSPCDYLALGHHHAALDVGTSSTSAAYCGSPTDTIGGGATYAVVDFDGIDGVRVRVEQLAVDR